MIDMEGTNLLFNDCWALLVGIDATVPMRALGARSVSVEAARSGLPDGPSVYAIGGVAKWHLDPARTMTSIKTTSRTAVVCIDDTSDPELEQVVPWVQAGAAHVVRFASLTTLLARLRAEESGERYADRLSTHRWLALWPERCFSQTVILAEIARSPCVHDVDRLARALDCSRTTLWRRCSRLFGVSPSELVALYCLACFNLAPTRVKPSVLAWSLGYTRARNLGVAIERGRTVFERGVVGFRMR